MTPHSRLRALSLVPALFGALGILIAIATVPFRHFWSPVPGIGVGVVVLIAAIAACRELWPATRRAPLGLLASGTLTLVAFLFLGHLFPLVNASSERPSLLERVWYPATLVTIFLLTIGSAWIARASLRLNSREH